MYRLVETELGPTVLEAAVEPVVSIEGVPAVTEVESEEVMVDGIPELATSVEVADSAGTVLSSDNTGSCITATVATC